MPVELSPIKTETRTFTLNILDRLSSLPLTLTNSKLGRGILGSLVIASMGISTVRAQDIETDLSPGGLQIEPPYYQCGGGNGDIVFPENHLVIVTRGRILNSGPNGEDHIFFSTQDLGTSPENC